MKMLPLLKTSLLLTLALLLGSCASTPKTNWYSMGYNDGAKGKNKRNFSQYDANTAPSLVINKTAYEKGWNAGVEMYCNPRHGLKLGMEGKLYNNVCPDHQISAFDKSWHEGIMSYCTAANGYKRGLEGGDFPGFCPPYANLAFKKAYDRGHRVYLKLKALKDKYVQLNAKVQATEIDIKTREKALEALQQAFAKEAFSPKKQYRIQKDKLQIKHLAVQMDELIQQRDAALQKYNEFVKVKY